MAVSADQEHSMLHRKPRILVVGSFVMDVIATTEQIPGAGQTVYGKSFHMAPGGKGANQALQCAGKVHPLCVCTFPARLKPNTVTLDRLPDTAGTSARWRWDWRSSSLPFFRWAF